MAGKRRKAKASRKGKKPGVTKLTPRQAEARDEGPRLIPLRTPQDSPKVDYWVELADKLLTPAGRKKGAGHT